jgi:hypothetical protein
MSKFLDYLKLVPQGLKNPLQVIEGFWNDYNFENLPKDEVEEIVRRRLICETCPFNSINAKTSQEYKDIFGQNYDGGRDELHCSICSCGVKKKTAALSDDCGMDSNTKTMSLPLKWTKYKQE